MERRWTLVMERKNRKRQREKEKVIWIKDTSSNVNISGAMDCGSHFRCRVHPRQADWYRYNKAGFFITAQVSGRVIKMVLGMGHNNDQGMFNLTGMGCLLEKLNVRVLGDGGYHHYLMVVPDDTRSTTWNNRQKALRSCVEVVIGAAKCWEFAAGKVRVSLELHSMGLMIIYNLVAKMMREYPLRIM